MDQMKPGFSVLLTEKTKHSSYPLQKQQGGKWDGCWPLLTSLENGEDTTHSSISGVPCNQQDFMHMESIWQPAFRDLSCFPGSIHHNEQA